MWTFLANIILIIVIVRRCECGCSTAYGVHEPCTYLPSPPGHAPSCAKPGDTFCETLGTYPMQHIKLLIDKWGYDYSTLFSSETRDEYSVYFSHPDYGYGTNAQQHNNYYPEPIHIPKPTSSFAPSGNSYIPPSAGERVNYTDNFVGYPDRRPTHTGTYPPNYSQVPNNHLNHQSNGYSSHNFQASGYYGQRLPQYEPTSRWRYSRSNKVHQPHYRNKRSPKTTNNKEPKKPTEHRSQKNGTDSGNVRAKRQSAISGQSLCQTSSQFIMPKAAVNNQGNWMYVVNLQEVDNRLTQLVKSETCASSQCSGLCGLPLGYSSRCEQKYVQKRLVALDGAGQRLYTDIFWFPSCCICTISGGA